jgi:hypothetical protein
MEPNMRAITILAAAIALWCVTATSALSQSSEELASRYNRDIQPINDEIEALDKKRNNADLSLGDAAKIIDQQSTLRKKADDLWNSYQSAIDDSFRKTRDAITDYNRSNQELDTQSAIVGSKIDGLNNVAKYPQKDDFEKNKAAMADDWDKTYGSRLKPFGEAAAEKKEELFKLVKDKYGIDMKAEGYSRIGVSNPYNGDYYYKYYDKDGNLSAGQWKPDADNWSKWQSDVDAWRRRQIDRKVQLDKESSDLNGLQDGFTESRNTVGGKLNRLNNNVLRINFFGSWSGGDTTGNNNSVSLKLNRDGSLTYSWRRTNASYSGPGTWQQSGPKITAQTTDRKYSLQSTITEDFRLEFNVSEAGTGAFRVYLNR